MKKLISILTIALLTASLFAVSYKNNTFQKLADEYTKKAEIALDAGEYNDAIEYSKKAEENAELSEAYIRMMMARGEAENNIKLAKNQIAWAEKIDAQNTYPMAYTSAKDNLEKAESAFDGEDYEQANAYAKASLAALDGVMLLSLGQKQKTVTGIFLVVLMFITTLCCGKIFIRQINRICQNLRIQISFIQV